jgi:hypothetical protein
MFEYNRRKGMLARVVNTWEHVLTPNIIVINDSSDLLLIHSLCFRSLLRSSAMCNLVRRSREEARVEQQRRRFSGSVQGPQRPGEGSDQRHAAEMLALQALRCECEMPRQWEVLPLPVCAGFGIVYAQGNASFGRQGEPKQSS